MAQDIKDLQESLLHCGYYPGTVDGVMGDNTKHAIRKFQKDNNLGVDGIAGSQTKMTLAARLGQASERVTELVTTMTSSAMG